MILADDAAREQLLDPGERTAMDVVAIIPLHLQKSI